MGRKIRRVPLDFDWPLKKVWQGFINPHYTAGGCPHCQRTGNTPVAKVWSDKWYGRAQFHPSETGSWPFNATDPEIVASVRQKVRQADGFYQQWFGGVALETAVLMEAVRMCAIYNGSWSHHLSQEDVQALYDAQRLHRYPGDLTECPPAAAVNRAYLFGMGHDSLNQFICLHARMARMGEELYCPHCDGEGILWPSEEARQRYEAWQEIEPPTGDGWQVWETVSEGSPVSPVFATSEALVQWLVQQGHSEATARNFVEHGWAPSAVLHDDGQTRTFLSGIDSLDQVD